MKGFRSYGGRGGGEDWDSSSGDGGDGVADGEDLLFYVHTKFSRRLFSVCHCPLLAVRHLPLLLLLFQLTYLYKLGNRVPKQLAVSKYHTANYVECWYVYTVVQSVVVIPAPNVASFFVVTSAAR